MVWSGESPAKHSSPKESATKLPWDSIASFLSFWLEKNPLVQPEKAVFEKYYTSYRRRFSPYIKHHFSEQTEEITNLIQQHSSPRLLEIGAGCGTESLWLGLMGARVTALDLNVDRLGVAQARKEWLQKHLNISLDVNFQESSLFEFFPSSKFDLIWMEQTFHHLEPRAKVYSKLFELLNPGGSLVISDVNAWNPLLQLQLFLRRGFKTKTFFVDKRGKKIEYGNERITIPLAMKRGLETAGFKVTTIRSYRLLPNSNPPKFWLKLERAVLKIFPFLSSHFNLVAYKPAD